MAKIFVLNNGTGSRFYRLVPQLKKAQELGHEIILEKHDTPNALEKIAWADIVIFQMVFAPDWINYAKKLGKKIIFECDDLIHDVPKDHYFYNETRGIINKARWWYRLIDTFRKCDGFISTCDNLDKIYGRFAKKSLVFPNYCDVGHWLKEYKPNTTDKIRILYAGSTSHIPDSKWITPIIKKIQENYPQVQFIYIGHGGIQSNDLQAKFVYGEDLFKDLKDNRESMLSVPPNVWPYILSTLKADIAIAPLVKNNFNKYKSQCKFIEYSINKIPAVYSGWFYTDVINRHTGILAETFDDWYAGLAYLIEHPEERKRIGENAYQDVLKNHDINNYLDNWINFVIRQEIDEFKNS